MDTRRRLVTLSGSGVSADSGLDTFRTSGGKSLWARFDPDIVCNFDCWEDNFTLVHQFYSLRRQELGAVQPNAAHFLLADWQRRYDAVLVTQNVDDLFERAGAQDVLHVHGSLTGLRCLNCGEKWQIGYAAFDPSQGRCPNCRSSRSVKPDVVFFNEPAPLYAKLWRLLAALRARDVLVVIGTSGQVLPIEEIARLCPATSILSNLGPEPAIDEGFFDHVLHGRAAEIAPKLDLLIAKVMAR